MPAYLYNNLTTFIIVFYRCMRSFLFNYVVQFGHREAINRRYSLLAGKPPYDAAPRPIAQPLT